MADGPFDQETGELIPRDREKDRGDLYFLRQLFAAQGKLPPEE